MNSDEIIKVVVILWGVYFIISLLWATLRPTYYRLAGKVIAWDNHQAFMRRTGYLEKELQEEQQRQAERDARAAGNTNGKRIGVVLATGAILWIAASLNLPIWQEVSIVVLAYAGFIKLAGLCWPFLK